MEENKQKEQAQAPDFEKLIKENAMLRDQITRQAKYIRDLENVVSARERIALLMEITAKDNKFPVPFVKAVRAELMYLVNGYDPEGKFGAESENEVEPDDKAE